MEVNEKAAGYVTAYLSEIRQTVGDRKALEIFAERFGEIPESARDEALDAAAMAGDANGSFLPILDLVKLLAEDADRVRLARRYLNPHGDPAQALAALQMLGPEPLQLQALLAEARIQTALTAEGGDSGKARTFLTGLMEQARISPGGREQVEAVLPPSGE
jgi:hypothetical protein